MAVMLLVRGELAVDTENKRLYTENAAGAVVELGSNPSGNITFADNGKAIFGAGSDLEILSNGTDGLIRNGNATGEIRMESDDRIIFADRGFNEVFAVFNDDDDVKLYHDGNQKLATTATGIDVTGVVEATGYLAVEGTSGNTGAAGDRWIGGDGTAGTWFYNVPTGSNHYFGVNNSNKLAINSSGIDVTGAATFTGNVTLSTASAVLNVGGGGFTQTNYGLLGLNGASGGFVKMGTSGTVQGEVYANSGGLTFQTPATYPMTWYPAGALAMTLDASGNLLVGTTSAFGTTGTTINAAGLVYSSADGDRSGQFDRTGVSDGEIVRFTKAGTTVGSIGANNGVIYFAGPSANAGGFRIDSTGSNGVIIPTTNTGANRDAAVDLGYSSGGTNVRFRTLYLSTNIHQGATIPSSSAAGVLTEAVGRVTYSRGSGTGGFGHVTFINGNGTVGSIVTASSATSYNTSSDYRLKENVVAMSGATERLKQLKPSRFNFIADADTTVDGFLAHEVQDIVPEAITGTKDAVDADGNPEYQGIDQSKLVPLLVATIQELEARIAIAALES
jgi:hypothetical protein